MILPQPLPYDWVRRSSLNDIFFFSSFLDKITLSLEIQISYVILPHS
jgi:hypothetical protein